MPTPILLLQKAVSERSWKLILSVNLSLLLRELLLLLNAAKLWSILNHAVCSSPSGHCLAADGINDKRVAAPFLSDGVDQGGGMLACHATVCAKAGTVCASRTTTDRTR